MHAVSFRTPSRDISNNTMNDVPPIFCWTKMGAEAGQDLRMILRRKELERQCGDGVFSWGIGNSVAPALAHAKRAIGGRIDALFTRMKSSPKEIDTAPASSVMWLGYYAADAAFVELPAHMLITSRQHGPSGSEKRAHYALLCKRDRGLSDQDEHAVVDAARTRNLISEQPVGASQVTAVVKYSAKDNKDEPEKSYPVVFRAGLVDEGFVRLAAAVPLSGELRALHAQLCEAENPEQWMRLLRTMKTKAWARTKDYSRQSRLALLEG